MPTIQIRYTPNYEGARPVNREEKFTTLGTAAKFLTRMKKLYPDTKEI